MNNIIKQKKDSLRKTLLASRDNISFDLIQITSKQIHSNLKKIPEFQRSKKIASYYPIGSEVRTLDIMQEAQMQGNEVFLPRINVKNLSFRRVRNWNDLEKGMFDIMEPKNNCPCANTIDVILVPAIGVSLDGHRLGYGHGFYDRFLTANPDIISIVLTFEKQIVKYIPFDESDVQVDWIVTEDRYIRKK